MHYYYYKSMKHPNVPYVGDVAYLAGTPMRVTNVGSHGVTLEWRRPPDGDETPPRFRYHVPYGSLVR